MKKYFLLSFIIFLSTCLFAQKITNKQFSLIGYNLNISKEITNELSDLDGFMNNIKTYNDPGNDKLRAIFTHIIYYTIKQKFEEELEIEILPINTFMRAVKYDDYGYPTTNIRDAMRKGDSKFYFKIDVTIESLTESKRKSNPELFEDIDYKVTFPQMSMEVVIYNNQGIIPVDKWVGTTTAKKPLPINEYLLKGFDNTSMTIEYGENQQADNFYLMLDRVIHNAIQDFYTK
jgi:hypothetical protein